MNFARFKRELRDLFECVLIPGLAAVMPWSLAYAVFRQISRFSFLYGESVGLSFEEAQTMGFGGDEKVWCRHRRLVTMVDHADFYLATSRSNRWLARHLCVEGSWPKRGEAALLCTFHWGAGMWGLRHLAASGMVAHALVAALDPAHFQGRWVYYHYIRLRNGAVSDALGTKTLEVGGSLRPVIKALKAGEQVLAAIDVPSDQVVASEAIPFLGSKARVPRGLLRLAAEQGVCVAVYLTGIRLSDGQRFLRIHQLEACRSLDDLMPRVFAYLEDAIREEPVQWHFWSVAERFFER